jgi:hypothetical protein
MLCKIKGYNVLSVTITITKHPSFRLFNLRFCRCLDRSLEIVETSGHFIHCFDTRLAIHVLWKQMFIRENNSLFVSRSEEMFVNLVES